MAVFEISENVIVQEFFNFMASVGVEPKFSFEPIMDGKTHYFATVEDKHGGQSGRYYIHADNFVNFGVMDFHKHSEFQKGSISRDYLPKYDKAEYEKAIEDSRRRATERAKQDKENEARARVQMMKEFTIYDRARRLFICNNLNTGYMNHPYFKFKGVEQIPFTAKLNTEFRVKVNQTSNDDFSHIGDLLIPLVHVDSGYSPCIEERMRDIQIISGRLNHEGKYQKSFYHNIPLQGCYCELIPYQCRGDNYFSDKVKIIFICEGVATGLSLLALTDFSSPVFCAMSCHNLINVAKGWRLKLDKHFHGFFKNVQIIIAADNDYSGLGVKKAQEVIDAGYAVKKIIPPEIGQDFNDYYLTTRRA